jgi:micrococcal nuclease
MHFVKNSAKLLSFIATIFIVNLAQAENKSCEHTSKSFQCVKYIRNYDADTITVSIPGAHPLIGEKIGVRVRGIDSPEIKGTLPCEKDQAKTAKRLIENILKNSKRIDLENVDRDKYFRILADVIVDSKNLKDVLLKNGLAYAYKGGTKEKRDWCKRLPASK